MADEIKNLFNSIPNLKKDWKEDFKENSKGDWKSDWLASSPNDGDGDTSSIIFAGDFPLQIYKFDKNFFLVVPENTADPAFLAATWDFGDGSALYSITDDGGIGLYHKFAPGRYTVTITGTGQSGSITFHTENSELESMGPTGLDQRYFTITPNVANPLDQIYASPIGTEFLFSTITASDSSSIPQESWLWDFGDGTTSTLQNPTHTYNIAGSFAVTCIINGDEIAEITESNRRDVLDNGTKHIMNIANYNFDSGNILFNDVFAVDGLINSNNNTLSTPLVGTFDEWRTPRENIIVSNGKATSSTQSVDLNPNDPNDAINNASFLFLDRKFFDPLPPTRATAEIIELGIEIDSSLLTFRRKIFSITLGDSTYPFLDVRINVQPVELWPDYGQLQYQIYCGLSGSFVGQLSVTNGIMSSKIVIKRFAGNSIASVSLFGHTFLAKNVDLSGAQFGGIGIFLETPMSPHSLRIEIGPGCWISDIKLMEATQPD